MHEFLGLAKLEGPWTQSVSYYECPCPWRRSIAIKSMLQKVWIVLFCPTNFLSSVTKLQKHCLFFLKASQFFGFKTGRSVEIKKKVNKERESSFSPSRRCLIPNVMDILSLANNFVNLKCGHLLIKMKFGGESICCDFS